MKLKRKGSGTVNGERRIDLGLTGRMRWNFLLIFIFGIVFEGGKYRKCSFKHMMIGEFSKKLFAPDLVPKGQKLIIYYTHS